MHGIGGDPSSGQNPYAYTGIVSSASRTPGRGWLSAGINFVGGLGLGVGGSITVSYLTATATAGDVAIFAVAAGGAAAGAVALVAYGAYEGTVALLKAVLGLIPTGAPIGAERRVDIAAGLAGSVIGGTGARNGGSYQIGIEILLGRRLLRGIVAGDTPLRGQASETGDPRRALLGSVLSVWSLAGVAR